MSTPQKVLTVQECGDRTVVSFDSQDALAEINLQHFRAEIQAIITANHPSVLAFDLSRVGHLPSSVLGLLVQFKKQGIAIRVFNLSNNIREVLRITHFDRLIEVEGPGEDAVVASDDEAASLAGANAAGESDANLALTPRVELPGPVSISLSTSSTPKPAEQSPPAP